MSDHEDHGTRDADTHPWTRYVAVGDSFTEGVGDPEPRVPGGNRGWADRVAEVLAEQRPEFAYANLAVRGKLIRQIIDEQLERAVELGPDLITISAGGNDVIRPGTDPDEIAELFDGALEQLSQTGATVVAFTGVDVGFSPVFRPLRGKVAVYNENVRAAATRHGAIVADQWSLRTVQDIRMFAEDRLHMNPYGHHEVARMVLQTLGVPNTLVPWEPAPPAERSWREARVEDLEWAREYLVPWVVRRLRHVSSGDHLSAKRPYPEPMSQPETDER